MPRRLPLSLLLLLLATPARAQFAGCPLTGQWTSEIFGGTFIANILEDGGGNGTGSSYGANAVPMAEILTSTRTGASIVATTSNSPGVTSYGTMIDCDTVSYLMQPFNVTFTSFRVRNTYCGDGTVDAPDETCDDGGFVNGDLCTVACEPAACGNQILETGEECDDGNTANGDGCSATCHTQACGNTVLEEGEACDDGNVVNGDGCSSTCQPNVCGNGTLESGEQCDDSNTTDGDDCSSLCQLEGCPITGEWLAVVGATTYVNSFSESGGVITGIGYPVGSPASVATLNGTRSGTSISLTDGQTGFVFASTLIDCSTIHNTSPIEFTSTKQRSTFCGDGTVQSPEICDDGNFINGDACTVACEPTGCGNGVVDGGEECDDGNQTNGDGCTSTCETQVCGNGTIELGETCDDGNATNGDGCSTACLPNVCGNGTTESGEQCDDGDTTNGDGCSSLCQFEGCSLTGTWNSPAIGFVGPLVEALNHTWTAVGYPAGAPANAVTGTGTRGGIVLSGTLSNGFAVYGVMIDCDTIQYTQPIGFTSFRVRTTYCGDGTVQGGDEACDDGNFTNGDTCSVACTTSSGCGNGVIDAGEPCDDGNANDHDACRNGCVAATCGDGVVRSGVEACDDGNTASGDGCAADCSLEPESSSGTVGGAVLEISTDPESDGATPGDPVETTVGVPSGTSGGSVSITEAAAPPVPPSGFVYVGTLVTVTLDGITPAPTTATPVRLAFTIDASGIPLGQNETTLGIQKDGVAVPACTGPAGHAVPDPCVTARERLSDGDVRISVLTTTASDWTAVASVCGGAPSLACVASVAKKSKLDLRSSGTVRKLTWKWKGAGAVGLGLFDGPDVSGDQTLCLYDASGLVAAATAPAGGTCMDKPCWKAKTTGFSYADKALTPDGLSKLTLKSGAAGKGKIGVKGAGSALPLPSLPLGSSVRVQLRSGDGGCFGSVFSTPTVDTSERYKAKSD